MTFFRALVRRFPELPIKLEQAEKNIRPEHFIRQVVMSSFYITVGITIALFLLVSSFGKSPIILILVTPVCLVMTFFYLLKLPDVIILRKSKQIDKEIVFAGKFMIVELNSGIPLYQVLKNIAENYGGIGDYFKRMIHDIDLGTGVEEAINKSILLNPSENFRKVMWQVSNSIRTGADVSHSLDGVLEQIIRQQQIEVERYGKKLNPIAMFYLMMAVILPSLGMVMGVVFASFMDIQLRLPALLFIAFVLGIFQFIFYAVIKSNRPAVDM